MKKGHQHPAGPAGRFRHLDGLGAVAAAPRSGEPVGAQVVADAIACLQPPCDAAFKVAQSRCQDLVKLFFLPVITLH